MRRRCFSVVALCGSLLAACEGGGDGQVSGTLFLRGCPWLDAGDHSPTELPSPLPAFTLNPQFFYAEVVWGVKTGLHPDPRTVDRLQLRLQRGSNKQDRSDGFELLVHDLNKLEQLQLDSIQKGLHGVPIVPPPIAQVSVPLPASPDSEVRAGLVVNNTCRYPRAEPSLRGYVRFSEYGRRVGETVAGEFDVTIEDQRAIREQGNPPANPDVAGALHGWFRIPIRSGSGLSAL